MKIYNCKHCGKEFIDRYKLTGHSTHCANNPNRLTSCNFNKSNKDKQTPQEGAYCKYCNKFCKSLNSLIQHKLRCKENPERIDISKGLAGINTYNHSEKKLICSSNQFSKAKKLDLPIPIVSEETRKKISEKSKLLKHSEETKQKIRESITQRHIELGFYANYNENACTYIDKLNETNGWNLQHAKNGGEFHIKGYWLDGYDKELNIAFEYDEPRHYIDITNNILSERDIQRQNTIINELHCEFWRYNEKLNFLYKIN